MIREAVECAIRSLVGGIELDGPDPTLSAMGLDSLDLVEVLAAVEAVVDVPLDRLHVSTAMSIVELVAAIAFEVGDKDDR